MREKKKEALEWKRPGAKSKNHPYSYIHKTSEVKCKTTVIIELIET